MKRIKLFFSFIIMLCLLPIITKAFTSLEISTPNPVKGTTFYIQLNINYLPSKGADPMIRDFSVFIDYDTEFFEYVGTTWLHGRNVVNATEGRIGIQKLNNGEYWPAQLSPVNIEFRAIKTGISEIKLKRDGDSHYKNGDIIAQSLSNVTVNTVEPSSNTLIGSLGVEGYLLEPTFIKDRTDYHLTVDPDVTSVKIVATSIDKKQTIEGTGKVYLDYGENIKVVRVKAQNGDYRDYTIKITRIDDRTGDTSLKSINISDTNIRLAKGVTSYKAIVGRSVDSVLISARTTDPKATLMGTGRKNLSIGKNTFQVTVTSSKNTKTVYTFEITRSTEELEKVVLSSKLKTLKANSLSFDLSNDKKIFATGVRKDSSSVAIEAVGESQTAKIEITGDKDLKYGLNAVKVKVTEILVEATDEEEAEVDETEYLVSVYRNPEDSEQVQDIKRINADGNPLFVSSPTASHIIPSNSVSYLKNYHKTLYYNVVNIYNGLVYQARIKDNLPDGDLDASFNRIEEGNITYETKLPKGTNMLLYLGDDFDESTNVRIYSYNEGEKYKLVTDGISVLNGYIEFELNGDTNYIITTAQLIKEQGPIEKFFSNNGLIIGVIGAIIAIVLIYMFVLHRHRDKRDAREPSY